MVPHVRWWYIDTTSSPTSHALYFGANDHYEHASKWDRKRCEQRTSREQFSPTCFCPDSRRHLLEVFSSQGSHWSYKVPQDSRCIRAKANNRAMKRPSTTTNWCNPNEAAESQQSVQFVACQRTQWMTHGTNDFNDIVTIRSIKFKITFPPCTQTQISSTMLF